MSITPAPIGFKVKYWGRLADDEVIITTRTLVGWGADGVPMVMEPGGRLVPAEDADVGVMTEVLDPGLSDDVEWEPPVGYHDLDDDELIGAARLLFGSEPDEDALASLQRLVARHRHQSSERLGVVKA
ncbi:hypothetical protein [Mycolicibacter kumamotonensis]|uniref:Uncharacterized protein n=1 Tax=Mycolicibacter kumamotonensis TaxID=354243 RepID=A0A1B8SCP1_9MYCO|nr:hypothetical protein [Mycolicibacter kumamotonensis]OBY30499.1 hypothetical protein ACT18_17305 [Mycolicibacter kumamotonensis]